MLVGKRNVAVLAAGLPTSISLEVPTIPKSCVAKSTVNVGVAELVNLTPNVLPEATSAHSRPVLAAFFLKIVKMYPHYYLHLLNL